MTFKSEGKNEKIFRLDDSSTKTYQKKNLSKYQKIYKMTTFIVIREMQSKTTLI